MDEASRAQLNRVFQEHASLLQAAEDQLLSRNEEATRLESEFRGQFEELTSGVILPVFEEVSTAVLENGHRCTVTRATFGMFFSNSNDAPGVVFMFYPGIGSEEDYVFKPVSSYVGVFADISLQKVQLFTKAVRPGGFMPQQLPVLLPLSEVTSKFLAATCIDVIKETLHRMEK